MALADHKPKFGDVEMTRTQIKDAIRNPMVQTKIKLRSKWQSPIKYKVLQTFQLKPVDRKEVYKILALAITPAKAKQHTYSRAFWGYRDISLVKDFECGVLTFKGLAVCLFYKRQVNEVEPVATDPIPLGALENDDDLYARLDLFSKSPRELHQSVREDLLTLTEENAELKYQVSTRTTLLAEMQSKLTAAETALKETQTKLKEIQSKGKDSNERSQSNSSNKGKQKAKRKTK